MSTSRPCSSTTRGAAIGRVASAPTGRLRAPAEPVHDFKEDQSEMPLSSVPQRRLRLGCEGTTSSSMERTSDSVDGAAQQRASRRLMRKANPNIQERAGAGRVFATRKLPVALNDCFLYQILQFGALHRLIRRHEETSR